MKIEKTIVRKRGLIGPMRPIRLIGLIALIALIALMSLPAMGQIKIGGNVYGGGNHGNVEGSSSVRVRAGEINKVFGGARMANVGGKAYVNIDGEHATDNMTIGSVYGGNDVAGTIGTDTVPRKSEAHPEGLTNVLTGAETKESNPKKNAIDNTWNAFVRTSRSKMADPDDNTKEIEKYWITIGSLFGGGNGDFIYTDENGDSLRDASGNYIVQENKMINGELQTITVATNSTPLIHPDLDKTYLEIMGGNIAHVYGGGNNATVRENTTIDIDNESDDCQKYVIGEAAKLWTADGSRAGTIDDYTTDGAHTMRHYMTEVFSSLKEMSNLHTFQSDITSFEFNHARIFGGNNKAAMAIRPTWNLQQGIIRDLYSGGNQGDMTSPEGLLVEINPDTAHNAKDLNIYNVFGGCRMADVIPLVNGVYTPCTNLPGYDFPDQLAARVLIRGGNIYNVYGGNDITGTVYGGNAVGIHTTINGDVYGGGNGAYAYTDQLSSKDHEEYGDFYYSTEDYTTSVEALNAHRPNAEQVSIRLVGTDASHPTIIKGSVFVGGNCASLTTVKLNPMVELKIGSHVIADKVFLGNNGEKMVDSLILTRYGNNDYSSLDLTSSYTFNNYMLGAAMDLQPSLVFDDESKGDDETYTPYSSYIGSFYCGGNRGSMIIPGKNTYEVNKGLYIFDKFVGGCNNAYVDELWTGPDKTGTQLCTTYEGGIMGSAAEQENYTDGSGKIKDRLEINLENLTIIPLRWIDDAKSGLKWNTQIWNDETMEFDTIARNPSNTAIRLMGGNVYGGCYNSGHVNGNITININDDLMKKDEVFMKEEGGGGKDDRTSGVKLSSQRDDVLAVAMSVFGAGYGEDTEIWGSTTVNLNKGYAFQIFGGGELGVVGRKHGVKDEHGVVYKQEYYYDPAFSCTVNLNGSSVYNPSEEVSEDLAETEYIYGGGNEGDVCGNTYVNLGNGLIYDAFGGASDANIKGHTEVYIGRQPNGSGGYKDGFPWIRDIVYGGNDFGGTIFGEYENDYNFTGRIRNYEADMSMLHGAPTNTLPGMLKSATYVEYLQGRVDTIFGGSYGYYDYTSEIFEDEEGNKATMPFLSSSFVNIRPKHHSSNHIKGIFGGGTGYPRNREGDKSQDRSYVLIDIPRNGSKDVDYFKDVEVYGSGSYNGMGMRFNKAATFEDAFEPDTLSAIVDLLRGKIKAVFGGSYNEGITARTVINVPNQSTIHIDSIFGGAYGTQILPPCDVYESNVNYCSTDATVNGAIYGGNNNERRTIYAKVNVHAPVWSNKTKGYTATVYGAGHGIDTWTEYTEVNLLDSARVYEVYGGGEMGHVLNAESVQKYMQLYKNTPSAQISAQDPKWSQDKYWNLDGEGKKTTFKSGTLEGETTSIEQQWAADWKNAWTIEGYYEPTAKDGSGNLTYTDYAANANTNLTNTALVTHDADIDDRDYSAYEYAKGDNAAAKASKDAAKQRIYKKYNANVRIHEGATVDGYAYGGGLGDASLHLSGDVYGTTYIALLGGTVKKDIYAAGTTGAIYDLFDVGTYNASTDTIGFTASATAYIKGGSCRNVYGGGWKGNVGYHEGNLSASTTNDRAGETHVVIGDINGTKFTSGIPTVQRNAYGGGEGGAVYGTAHLTLNNGYVGYVYNSSSKKYEENIQDVTKPTPNTFLQDAGCMFGGGYIDNSTVDKTRVSLYNGYVRGSVFGGGEIAAIGRGSISKNVVNGKTTYSLAGIYRPGKTNIEMFGGEVHRNVFGGGRGSDNLGGHGTLNCDGYVFGQTEVHIHGGEIGTVSGVADGNGNVFGGGDEGLVYSAYENTDGSFGRGVKTDIRYGGKYQGYYYKHAWSNGGLDEQTESLFEHENGDERVFTEDCKVLVEPHLKVTTAVKINNHDYKVGDYVPIEDLNTLSNKYDYHWQYMDSTGIIIHNAVFAGGNTPAGSLTTSANTATVFGNATASVNDIYHRDMITLGTRHTGGLYGDGNLTLVDGYRELNITNYGTDYYSIAKEIGIDAYHALPEREADYYELRYTCLKDCQDKDGTYYKQKTTDENGFTTKASTITADEMQSLFVKEIEVEEGGKTVKKKVSVLASNGDSILTYNYQAGEWVPNTNLAEPYWEESGVLPVYAGRLMNSIQRADFCGVFGSRMVMQGAQDRVPDEVDYTNYTINRVREVSLNKKRSAITADLATKDSIHGNYFGIYNIVNHLGALTSDVDFGDETNRPYARTTDKEESNYRENANGQAYGTASFYDWKKEAPTDRKRNNGNSHNKVALASGVYLEITSEESTGTGLHEKVWGPITGVVELDLINVSTGIGGGFVYAKNQHGIRSKSTHQNTTLTALNEHAVTQWDFEYSTTEDNTNQKVFETSGNFVHSSQTIIDDCYNVSNRYMGEGKMPAHYWYIKGSVYVYDQYISAYTGTPNAFSETIDIPVTLAAASHGRMKLLNVQPNLYAYYAAPGVKLEDGKKLIINDKTYYKNDPISYWDWYLLSKSEKELFVAKTYTNCITCKIDGTEYAAGTYVMVDTAFVNYKKKTHTYTDDEDNPILMADKSNADDDYIFRESNNVGHKTGYILTYEVNNPSKWDNWYTPKSDTDGDKITLAAYEELNVENKAKYYDGPTYYLNPDSLGDKSGMLLGQRNYKVGDLISKSVEDTYQAIVNKPASGQAVFEEAYIVPSKITYTDGDAERNYYPGTVVSKTIATANSIATDANTAYICTKSIQVTKEEIIYKDSKMSKTEMQSYITDVNSKIEELPGISDADAITDGQIAALSAENKKKLTDLLTLKSDLNTYLVPAYYCITAGLYGGNYYEKDKNYRALEAWSSMSEADHNNFCFNYDALDLLIDSTYANAEGQKYQYDGPYTSEEAVNDKDTGNKAGYSVTQSVDYTATYNGKTDDHEADETGKAYMEVDTSINGGKVHVDEELTREEFESLPNEQRHYAPIAVKDAGTYYVVHTEFQVGATPYAVGEVVSAEIGTTNSGNVTALTIDAAHKDNTYYYCRESYTPSGDITTLSSSDIGGAGSGAGNKGTLISAEQYKALPNYQTNFTIHGISPTETSTLFVSRESDIYDLSKEKIITVIYKYDYDETDGSGNVTPISERHVVNIHLTFKSGVPIVEDITQPDLILPGAYTQLREPVVTSGAYEVTGGGWELFERESDAESHTNGIDYSPNLDPLYWYQDGFYVAYYAKSYLGRTYSNHVPVSVANYHDLAKVMSDDNKLHHMYIDNKNVKRAPKIYINDYSGSGKDGLDHFKNLYDLSLVTGTGDGYIVAGDTIKAATSSANTALVGHALLNTQTRAERNLEFFLRTDINHKDTEAANEWTPIGNEDQCFDGVFHGDGHTISGLDNSLFGDLCGEVYNLGVTGSFNTAGVADTDTKKEGYVESCWVKTTSTTALSETESEKPYAVFGNPTDTKGYQLVNSYFSVDNKNLFNTVTDGDGVTTSGSDRGKARAMTSTEFYNGTVAYNLNNFYLHKRYSDKKVSTGDAYKYMLPGKTDPVTGKLVPQTGHYADQADLCSSGYTYTPEGKTTPVTLKYVEDRFADGDFRYAGGSIPDTEDERHWQETISGSGETAVKEDRWSPIWPDDYIFFGQKLTYGYNAYAHQEVPTAVTRDGGRLSLADNANRVYRAPAYFRSKEMGVAYFNPNAYLAQAHKDAPAVRINEPMTAIDFAGHYYEPNKAYGAYGLGTVTSGLPAGKSAFYPPLLDDDGLTSIRNCDETLNLLVYAPAASGDGYTNEATHDVLTSYFEDPAYTDYHDATSETYTDGKTYNRVNISEAVIYGHLVQSNLKATNDHLLVDKQDFNAPIAYDFDSSHRMWYQRTPTKDEFVDRTKGWQGVSIPFTAELVTTHQKGEITHFYKDSETSANSTSKIGHEYWLRELESGSTLTQAKDANGADIANTFTAVFNYPSAPGANKEYTNTFLWDYYYKNSDGHNQQDANDDTYLEYRQYYKDPHTHKNYSPLTKAKPYILGLPGKMYYEFDLSGNFEAKTTAVPRPEKLAKQTITFASATAEHINVSDDEMAGATASYSGTNYTFKPSYMNMSFDAGTDHYTLHSEYDSDGDDKADCSTYKKVPATGDATKVSAFRPYFVSSVASSRSDKKYVESIIFSDTNDGVIEPTEGSGKLTIKTGKHKIIVISGLRETTHVRITSVSGITLTTFDIEPGETIETPINMPGFYVVNKTKVAVR